MLNQLLLEETTSRAKREKLAWLLLEKQRRMADASLFYFCKYVLGFSLMELKPHWELCRFLENHGDGDCMILLPRGTFKSTVVSIGFVLWKLTKNRDLRFLISSYKEDNPKGWLSQIKQIVQMNRTFRMLYGEWDSDRNKGTWAATAVNFSGRTKFLAQSNITVSSLRGTEVSQHYDYAILDDVQTDENVSSKEMIDEVDGYLQRVVSLLDPLATGNHPGPRILVGTRWGFDDVYARIIARDNDLRKKGKQESFKKLIRKAYEGRRVYFPSRFPKHVLDHMRETMGMSLYLFSCNYLNDPQPEGTEVFSLKDFCFYYANDTTGKGRMVRNKEIADLPVMLNRFTTIDPAISESSDSDYSAFVTVAADSDWNYFIWNVNRYRMNPDQVIEEMFRVQSTYRPFRMGLETVTFQKAILFGFERECRLRGNWFPVEPLKTDTSISKELRIRGFQPFVKGRKVFFRVKENTDLTLPASELLFHLVEDQDVLADELLRFPTGPTRDCADALAYMPQLVFPAGPPPKPKVDPMSFEALLDRLDRTQRSPLTLRTGR